MIYLWNFDQTLAKVYELEGRILAQGVHLKKVLKICLLFFETGASQSPSNFKC